MDPSFRWGRAVILVAAVSACSTLAASSAPQLREKIWSQAAADPAHMFTHAPAECLARTDDAAQTQSIEIGRALFRSPALLGGPAARTGLSCNACHSNGRVNAHFFLPELTNRAGAADVTSEWDSKVRGDGVMNPRDIPDLVDVSTRPALGRLHEPSLEHFVSSAIADEFQGPRPPDAAFAGLMAYLRALHADACPAGQARVTLTAAADDVRRALDAARAADAPTARLVLLATQDAVGRVVERLPAPAFAQERRDLEALARELGGARNEGAQVGAALESLAPGWMARFDAVIARVARRENATYFDERTLRRALAANRT